MVHRAVNHVTVNGGGGGATREDVLEAVSELSKYYRGGGKLVIDRLDVYGARAGGVASVRARVRVARGNISIPVDALCTGLALLAGVVGGPGAAAAVAGVCEALAQLARAAGYSSVNILAVPIVNLRYVGGPAPVDVRVARLDYHSVVGGGPSPTYEPGESATLYPGDILQIWYLFALEGDTIDVVYDIALKESGSYSFELETRHYEFRLGWPPVYEAVDDAKQFALELAPSPAERPAILARALVAAAVGAPVLVALARRR